MSEDSKAVQIPGWLVGAAGTIVGIVVSVVGFLLFFDARYAPADTGADVAKLEARLARKADADETATKAELLLIDQRLGFSAAQLARIEKKVDLVASAVRQLPPGPRQARTPGAPAPPKVVPEPPSPDEVEDQLDEILRELERRRVEKLRREKPAEPAKANP